MQLNATASVPGTFVYTPAAGTVLAAGTHTLGVTFTPTDTTRYTAATASTTLVVTAPATPPRTTPTVSWRTPQPIAAGTPLGRWQLNATAGVPGTFVYAPAAGTVLAEGSYTLTVTFTPVDTSLYTTATASVTLTVNPPVFRLTVLRPTGGTISAAGITCGTGGTDCTETASAAVWLALVVTPAPGYTFTGWTGDCTGSEPIYALYLGGTRTCSATFTAGR